MLEPGRLWRDFVACVEGFVFYPYCLLCERRLEEPGQLVCPACLEELPPARPALLRGEALVGNPRLGVFLGVASVWRYSEQVERLIHMLKYQRRPALARPIARRMAPFVRHLGGNTLADVALVPVPLHKARRRERGYNQSALLAQHIGAEVGVPVVLSSLSRVRSTRSQATLSRDERLKNVVGAFRVVSTVGIADKHCVLVDDVMTTGATASACAGELLRVGVRAVSLLTAARA